MKPHTILAVIGDTQIGGSTALAPPKFTIHNRDTNEAQVVEHNRLQAWLWSCWLDYWQYVRELAGLRGRHRKHRIAVVHLGDAMEGNHHGSVQLIAEDEDQYQLALDILQPVADMADVFYGILGTEAHGGPADGREASLYKELSTAEYGYHLMLRVDGKLHDFAHHGRVGRRPYTSQAAAIATEVVMDCAATGAPIPDYIWRGHNHTIDDSGYKIEGTRCICTPSWQLKTVLGHRVSANRVRSDIGGFVVNGGEVDGSRARYRAQPDGRRIIEV